MQERSPSPPPKQLRRKKKNKETLARDEKFASIASPEAESADNNSNTASDASPLRTQHHVPIPATATTIASKDVSTQPTDNLDTFTPSTSTSTLDTFLAYHSDEESAIVERRNKIRECAKSIEDKNTVKYDEDDVEVPSSKSSLRSVRKSRKR